METLVLSPFQQALILFGVLQIIFGYYEYRANPNLVAVVPRLFQAKYLVPSGLICLFYLIVGPLLKRFLGWFFNFG